MISFCITCHKRQWQLEQTLPSNLALARQFGYEICLVNYGAIKELDIYIEENFSGDREDKVLRYYSTPAPRFHASHAKNIAHLLGTRDIVFNLDADNYITSFHQTIYKLLSENPNVVVHNWSGSYVDGTYGRIGMTKKNFEELGGYDESFRGIEWEDVDLIMRVQNKKLKYHLIPFLDSPLPVFNTQEQKVCYTDSPNSYADLYQYNSHRCQINRWRGVIQANERRFFGLSEGELAGSGTFQTGFRNETPWVRPLRGLQHFASDILEVVYWKLIHASSIFLYWKILHPIFIFLYWRVWQPFFIFLYWKILNPTYTFLCWRVLHRIYIFLYWKIIYRFSLQIYGRALHPVFVFFYWKICYRLYCIFKYKVILRIQRIWN